MSKALAALGVACAALAVAPESWGQEARERPNGIVIGPWILAPSYAVDFAADTNVLGNSFEDDTEDTSLRHGAELEATLPFRESQFELSYEARDVAYRSHSDAGDVTQTLGAELELNFRTGDQLTVRERFVRDTVRVRDFSADLADPDAEESFFGEPFHDNSISLAFERDEPGRQGYLMLVNRRDFVYEGDAVSGLYDYRGYDAAFEYRQPFSARRGFVVNYGMRRLNHYAPNQPDQVGVPFRKEIADSLELGIRGQLGPDQPFVWRLGYDRFQYEGQGATVERKASAFARWRLKVGGRTSVNLVAARQQLPSNLDDHYTNNRLRATAVRAWSNATRVSLGLGMAQNRYDNVTDELICDGIRDDLLYDVGAQVTWDPHPMLRLRAGASHEARNSNCDGVGYESQEIDVGLSIGWF